MKTNKFWIIILSVIILASAALALLIGVVEGSTAHIYSGGELIQSLDLTAVREAYTVVVVADVGTNTIEVERGRIRVLEADCSDGTCMRQGWVSGGLTPIVCLPHGLVIQIEGGSGVDAVVG